MIFFNRIAFLAELSGYVIRAWLIACVDDNKRSVEPMSVLFSRTPPSLVLHGLLDVSRCPCVLRDVSPVVVGSDGSGSISMSPKMSRHTWHSRGLDELSR